MSGKKLRRGSHKYMHIEKIGGFILESSDFEEKFKLKRFKF